MPMKQKNSNMHSTGRDLDMKSGPMKTIKPYSNYQAASKKSIGYLNNSHDNSPGKLMNNFRNEQLSPKLFPPTEMFPISYSIKTLDLLSDYGESKGYCENCTQRMKAESKQAPTKLSTPNAPSMLLSQSDSSSSPRAYSDNKQMMLIFDVRYEELQEHGTLPNCFRFSLKERLTDDDVNKFIKDYSCCKNMASTICILGAGNLTNDIDKLNRVEHFHVKAVNKIISKMEKQHFMHVTVLEEGFEKLHEYCKQHELRIQEHSPEACYYCIKGEGGKVEDSKEGTFKTFADRFRSVYAGMGKRLKNLMFKDKDGFIVENEDNQESPIVSIPDFDPSRLDSEIEGIQDDPTLDRIKTNTNAPMEKLLKAQMDGISPTVAVKSDGYEMSSSDQSPSKKEKDYRNRSSEFTKNDLNIMKPELNAIHRNSNELWGHKKNLAKNSRAHFPDNRRMYASGYRFSNTHDKITEEKQMSLSQNCSLTGSETQGSLQESMTRKKITAFKLSSKNSNQDFPASKTANVNLQKAPKPAQLAAAKRSSSTVDQEKCSPKAPNPHSRKHVSENGKRKFKGIGQNRPKSSKNSSCFTKENILEDTLLPKGLTIIQKSGPQDYYLRFGISKILKLPMKQCEEYFASNAVQLFKCQKVKAIQGKQKKDEDEKLIASLFPEPYDIFLVVSDTAVFTTVDIKADKFHVFVDSRYTMYDLVKITSRKNSGNVITFYFRIPKYLEYNLELENDFLSKIDQKPSEDYIFAHKRKSYIEICVVIQFENPEKAHECIKKVSELYKQLKSSQNP